MQTEKPIPDGQKEETTVGMEPVSQAKIVETSQPGKEKMRRELPEILTRAKTSLNIKVMRE